MNTTKQSNRWKPACAFLAAVTTLVIAGCGGSDESATSTSASSAPVDTEPVAASTPALPQGSEPVNLDPAEFTTKIDNPLWPMSPGSRWVYRETDTTGSEEKVVVEVTDKTKTIANGVEALVVRDTASVNGVPTEVTDDWYAQDSAGNIWYMGEETAEYKNGKVDTRAGSFEAGVNGAQPGVALPADPQPGMSYRQEYAKGEAEDRGGIVTTGQEQVEVPFGFFDRGVVMTRDLVPLEPKVQELKFYAPGVGPVLSVHLDGTGGRSELVSYKAG